MNLLSISQLLTEGSVFHLEQGKSYILIKDKMTHHMRKVVLEEENGLFFLPLEVSDGGSQVCDPVVAARANLAVASENLLRDAARLLDGGSGRGEARGEELNGACAFVGANAATLEL